MAENPRNRPDHTPDTDAGEGIASPRRTTSRHTASSRALPSAAPTYRWECHCRTPHVLLATYSAAGRMNIKVRDRYWHLYGFGQVHAVCPRCAAEHILDLRDLGDLADHTIDDSAPTERPPRQR